MTKLIRGLYNIASLHKRAVVTIGNFDGVHPGHQVLINKVKERAAALKVPSIVITFEPQPIEFFSKENAVARLTRWREKYCALAHTGVAITKIKDVPTKSSVKERLGTINKAYEEQSSIMASIPIDLQAITQDRIERLTRVIPVGPVAEQTKALAAKVSLNESKAQAISVESSRAVIDAKPLIPNDVDRVAFDKFTTETRRVSSSRS